MYGMHMPVLDVRMWPTGDVPSLGLTDEDVGLLRGVDCDILTQGFNRIDRIFISPRYTFFSGSPHAKNSVVKRAWSEAILEWVTDREVFSGVHK
jgi:hypothetical protein